MLLLKEMAESHAQPAIDLTIDGFYLVRSLNLSLITGFAPSMSSSLLPKWAGCVDLTKEKWECAPSSSKIYLQNLSEILRR